MILHLKSSNVICITQQSDLLMYSSGQKKEGGGLFQRHIVSHIKMEGTPPHTHTHRDFNTIKSTKIRLFFAALHPLLQNGTFAPNWSNFLAWRTDALLQGFLVLLLSEPGDEKTCFRGLWPVKIQSGLLSYRY